MIPPSSASVKRGFSRQAWLQSAKRNRLTNERAAKTVFISHNGQGAGKSSRTKRGGALVDEENMDDDEDMVHGSEGLNDFYGFNPNESDISLSQLSDMDFTDNESNNDGGCDDAAAVSEDSIDSD